MVGGVWRLSLRVAKLGSIKKVFTYPDAVVPPPRGAATTVVTKRVRGHVVLVMKDVVAIWA